MENNAFDHEKIDQQIGKSLLLSDEDYFIEFDKFMRGEPNRLDNATRAAAPTNPTLRLHPMNLSEQIEEVTALMREADNEFHKVGGSTRHYVRDVLLPLMESKGLGFCRIIK